jgi:hypothetical protein
MARTHAAARSTRQLDSLDFALVACPTHTPEPLGFLGNNIWHFFREEEFGILKAPDTMRVG